jgi:hypothetical protein
LTGHIEVRREAEEPVPAPSTLDKATSDPQFQDGVAFLVHVEEPAQVSSSWPVGNCATGPASGQPLSGVVHGLRDAAVGQWALLRDQDRRGAVADQPVRHQGRRWRRLHARTRRVVSATIDALSPLGVRDITMPVTPFKMWWAIRDAQADSGGASPPI